MKNNFFLKFLSSFWFRSGLIASITIAAAFSIVMAADYYQVVNNAVSVKIQEHGKCRYIKNSRARDIFVPTKTAAEWDAFIGQTDYSGTLSIYNCYYCSLGSTYASLITCNSSCSQTTACNPTYLGTTGGTSWLQNAGVVEISGNGGNQIKFANVQYQQTCNEWAICTYTKSYYNVGYITLPPGVTASGMFLGVANNNNLYATGYGGYVYMWTDQYHGTSMLGETIGSGYIYFYGASISGGGAETFGNGNGGATPLSNGFKIYNTYDPSHIDLLLQSSAYTCPPPGGTACDASHNCIQTGTCSLLP